MSFGNFHFAELERWSMRMPCGPASTEAEDCTPSRTSAKAIRIRSQMTTVELKAADHVLQADLLAA